jgi:hypothetical protein
VVFLWGEIRGCGFFGIVWGWKFGGGFFVRLCLVDLGLGFGFNGRVMMGLVGGFLF